MIQMELLDDLTWAQREAVTHGEGPLLVLAGAGSGKTRVITRRIAYLLAGSVRPREVLAITFTNKAAGEMRRRVSASTDLSSIWIGTFHGICARILRQHAEWIGRRSDFTIYDAAGSEAVIKAEIAALGLDSSIWSPREMFASIRSLKDRFDGPDAALEEARGERDEIAASLYERYEKTLRAANALDFDDLLLKVVTLMRDDRDILDSYNERFRHVLVDEFQDTNRVQYMLLKQLSYRRRNLCATGDPDQSIYTWRGATLENILNFENDYPDAKVVRLEENFRSTKSILYAADSLIRHNVWRKEKALLTNNPAGGKIELWECSSAQAEAAEVAGRAATLIGGGASAAEIAVFYRVNAQSRMLEDAMRAQAIPYIVVGAVEFYRRAEVKDILAYAGALHNDDDVCFERIINVPARGIGGVTVDRVRALARERATGLYHAARAFATEEIADTRARGQLTAFLNLMAGLRRLRGGKVADLLKEVVARTGYRDHLVKLDKHRAADRIANIDELITAAGEYDAAEPNEGLGGFLEKTALVSDTDALEGAPRKVSLMTLHAAKGLEFESVFITGVEDGLLPHGSSQGSQAEIEEERRLLFVGMTRAKKSLWITCCRERDRYGSTFYPKWSSFLDELPAEVVVRRQLDGSTSLTIGRSRTMQETAGGFRPREAAAGTKTARQPGRFEKGPQKGYDGSRFRCGDVVHHGRFGAGRILELCGSGDQMKAKVIFDASGIKSLVLKYARLKKGGGR